MEVLFDSVSQDTMRHYQPSIDLYLQYYTDSVNKVSVSGSQSFLLSQRWAGMKSVNVINTGLATFIICILSEPVAAFEKWMKRETMGHVVELRSPWKTCSSYERRLVHVHRSSSSCSAVY